MLENRDAQRLLDEPNNAAEGMPLMDAMGYQQKSTFFIVYLLIDRTESQRVPTILSN